EGDSFATLRKVVRVARIKHKNGSSIKRPVILVAICLGGIRKMTEVTLTNRQKFSVPILIGRSFLAGMALVDSSKKYTTDPRCEEGQAQ
ncbi:MAG: hypothetical protein ACI9MU_002463, partial [Alphaproteobacteria bacterium]